MFCQKRGKLELSPDEAVTLHDDLLIRNQPDRTDGCHAHEEKTDEHEKATMWSKQAKGWPTPCVPATSIEHSEASFVNDRNLR